jgi:hypothetical protein
MIVDFPDPSGPRIEIENIDLLDILLNKSHALLSENLILN